MSGSQNTSAGDNRPWTDEEREMIADGVFDDERSRPLGASPRRLKDTDPHHYQAFATALEIAKDWMLDPRSREILAFVGMAHIITNIGSVDRFEARGGSGVGQPSVLARFIDRFLASIRTGCLPKITLLGHLYTECMPATHSGVVPTAEWHRAPSPLDWWHDQAEIMIDRRHLRKVVQTWIRSRLEPARAAAWTEAHERSTLLLATVIVHRFVRLFELAIHLGEWDPQQAQSTPPMLCFSGNLFAKFLAGHGRPDAGRYWEEHFFGGLYGVAVRSVRFSDELPQPEDFVVLFADGSRKQLCSEGVRRLIRGDPMPLSGMPVVP